MWDLKQKPGDSDVWEDDPYWKAVAGFLQKHMGADDLVVTPLMLTNRLATHCHAYNDELTGNCRWVAVHKGMLPQVKALGLFTACLVLQPLFANEIFVVFGPRDRLAPLPPGDPHYQSFLRMMETITASPAASLAPATREEIISVVRSMVSPVVSGKPNLDPLAQLLKEMPSIMFNIKNFGYELTRRMTPALEAVPAPQEPQVIVLKSKATTSHDIESAWLAYWCKKLGIKPVYHRKIWELCYVAQAIWQSVDFKNSPHGPEGIGFGCGEEPLPSLFASMGANITVTDLAPGEAAGRGWMETGQHTRSLGKVFQPHIIDEETFHKRVTLKFVDMNAIPPDLHGKYDFCWSVCALEHLGSLRHGLDFIANSLRVLKSGGIAVHTTEYNFTDRTELIDSWPVLTYRRRHFEQLHRELTARGCKVCPLDFDTGSSPIDGFIDVPPCQPNDASVPGMKLSIDGIPSTCFGLIITAP